MIKRLSLAVLIAALAVVFFATPVAAAGGPPCPGAWFRVGVLTDLSVSAANSSTPALRFEDLEPIIAAVNACGGEIGAFPVTARATGGLIRLRIEAPREEPRFPSTAGKSVFAQRDAAQRYQAEHNLWRDAEARRQADAVARIAQFKAELAPVLLAPRSATRSDVTNALVRLDRFLLEEVAGGRDVRRLLLIASDLSQTASRKTYTLTSNPISAWVLRETPEVDPTEVFGNRPPSQFEAPEPAVTWLMNHAPAITLTSRRSP